MKNFIFVLITIILTSCTMDRFEYNYKINYTIGDVSYERTGNLPDVPVGYTPTYIVIKGSKQFPNNKIVVQTRELYGQSYPFCTDIVYVGEIPCTVSSFDYWEVRRFKVSRLDGREIKRQ